MKTKLIFILTFVVSANICQHIKSQTLYVPGGTGGIGNNTTNGNVGIGTSAIVSKLTLLSGEGSILSAQTSYSGNNKIFEVTQESSDGFLYLRNAIGTTVTKLSGYSTVPSFFNSSVGIGTASPFAKLSVSDSNRGMEFTPYWEGGNGSVLEIIDRNDYSKRIDLNFYIGNNGGHIKFYTSATEKVRITKDGNMGVGTNSPFSKISYGTGSAFNSSTKRLAIEEGTDGAYFYGIGGAGNSTKEGLGLWGGTESEIPWNGSSGVKPHMFILRNTGNVGIGTIEPGNYKLNVVGKIRANEIVVNTTGADFVFEPTYKLLSLSELETFIRTNKHLPDIAPAKEMQENGVSAGEMQTKLLQKVEELTLYVIELKKENEQTKAEKDKQLSDQQKMIVEMQRRLDALEKTK